MKEEICKSCGHGLDNAHGKRLCYFCDNEVVEKNVDYWPYPFHRNCLEEWKRTLPKDKCELCSRYFYTNSDYIKNPELLKDVVLEKWDLFDLLKYAFVEGDLGLIEKLYSVGENIYVEDDFALRISAELGRLNLVKFLIEHGAYVHAENDAALLLSALNGHFEVVKYLIEHAGADPRVDNESALISSTRYGNLEIVKYLVERGANVHANDDLALLYCAQFGYLDILKYLVEQGANINARNALTLGIAFKHTGVVKVLIGNGADTHVVRDNSIILVDGSDELRKYLAEKRIKTINIFGE